MEFWSFKRAAETGYTPDRDRWQRVAVQYEPGRPGQAAGKDSLTVRTAIHFEYILYVEILVREGGASRSDQVNRSGSSQAVTSGQDLAEALVGSQPLIFPCSR